MLNAKKFRKIYDDFLESGLTVTDFCSNQGLTQNKFFYWQNKLKAQLPPKKGFVPIVLKSEEASDSFPMPAQNQILQPSNPVLPSANETQSCEINFPNGVSVKLTGCTDLELIRSLILLNTRDHV
ncbi:IS66 family insertion sequence element accessory protein TnpA [Carboxylicivirga caseinilyticus]|uniref:IS66 family insertion sequence element accessory protein TnpA n=1 Tax=Carboxylicivirga caseinilyticus TaxID=3417572 RepID=UPI003D348A3D|nr:hypothetical protein [Marinilabiliaceae bacterium A049]